MHVVENAPYYLYSVFLSVLIFLPGLLILSRHYKPILLSSLFALPQSFLSPLVVPEYWDPEMHLLFGLVGLEDLAFSFLTGGTVWMGVILLLSRKHQKYRISPDPVFRRFLGGSLFGVFSITFLYLIGIKSLYNPLIVMGLWIIFVLSKKGDYPKVAVAGSLSFLLIYTLYFKICILIWPEFVLYWNKENLLGIYPLGIPLEEMVWAFLYGGSWGLGVAYFLGFNESGGLDPKPS